MKSVTNIILLAKMLLTYSLASVELKLVSIEQLLSK
jgi:hypothetical protein